MSLLSTRIPDETLERIFGNLSDNRDDIANCRLVNKRFKACSTQFFLRRVTFARRLGALTQLWKILRHPELHQHVTELVYDASMYETGLAWSFEAYQNDCYEAYLSDITDDDAARTNVTYVDFHRRVFGYMPNTLPTDPADHRRLAVLHRSFQRYRRRWMTQLQIMHDGLDHRVLAIALTGLPRLRRIIFADFRALAREGEPYQQLTQRIFGKTLEPGLVDLGAHWGVQHFLDLVTMLAGHPTVDTRALFIGECPLNGAPYSVSESWPARSRAYFNEFAIPCDPRWEKRHSADAYRACRNLEDLRLPISFKDHPAFVHQPVPLQNPVPLGRIQNTFPGELLRAARGTLVRLSLVCGDLVTGHGTDRHCLRAAGKPCLELLIMRQYFPELRYLQLQGWPLPKHPVMQDFLARHRATLKELRMLDCGVFDCPEQLAKWAGQNLTLDGVEVTRVENFQEPVDDEGDQGANRQGVLGQGMFGQGMFGQGVLGRGVFGQGVPGQGVPGQGVPGQGVPGQRFYGDDMPGQGMYGPGMHGPGMPGQGVPGQGVPGDYDPDEPVGGEHSQGLWDGCEDELERAWLAGRANSLETECACSRCETASDYSMEDDDE